MADPASPRTFKIAICGGGIGGLALAIALLRQGVPVHIYEAASAFAEIGAGVSFGPNAVRAMSLIDPKIRQGYDRRSTSNGWLEKKDVWFDYRLGMDHKDGKRKAGDWFHATIAPGVGQSSVHRAHFLDELVKLVPEECATFGKRVEKVEPLDDGVKLVFSDGSEAEASAVIGCDGIKSQIRPILLGRDAPASHAVFSGKYAYRGLIPMPKAVDLLGDDLARNSQMYIGYHGHILTFPIEKGKTMNVVAFKSKKDGEWKEDRWVLPMKRTDMEEDFKDWGSSVKSILSLMEKPDVWALFDHPPAHTYNKGRICLLGDAAHATTPHQGSGAGMALEDAYILSNLLGQIKDSMEIERAFKAYEAVRKERSQKVVTTSRTAGRVYDLEQEGVEDNLEKLSKDLEERQKWIWNHDLEKDMGSAKASLARQSVL